MVRGSRTDSKVRLAGKDDRQVRESWLLWSLGKAGLPVRRKDAGLKAWHKDPGLPRLRWGRAGELDLQNCKLKTALLDP